MHIDRFLEDLENIKLVRFNKMQILAAPSHSIRTDIPPTKIDQSKRVKFLSIVPSSNQRTPMSGALWDDFL